MQLVPRPQFYQVGMSPQILPSFNRYGLSGHPHKIICGPNLLMRLFLTICRKIRRRRRFPITMCPNCGHDLAQYTAPSYSSSSDDELNYSSTTSNHELTFQEDHHQSSIAKPTSAYSYESKQRSKSLASSPLRSVSLRPYETKSTDFVREGPIGKKVYVFDKKKRCLVLQESSSQRLNVDVLAKFLMMIGFNCFQYFINQ